MTDALITADTESGQVSYIDGAAYEKLLRANERELWALTEEHGRLVNYVRDALWPRVRFVSSEKAREGMAAHLRELGVEVEA